MQAAQYFSYQTEDKTRKSKQKAARNNQAQSGMRKNAWEKLQKKTWSIYEVAQTGNKWKRRDPKEKWELQLWQLGSYFFKVKIAQSKQSVLSEKQKH